MTKWELVRTIKIGYYFDLNDFKRGRNSDESVREFLKDQEVYAKYILLDDGYDQYRVTSEPIIERRVVIGTLAIGFTGDYVIPIHKIELIPGDEYPSLRHKLVRTETEVDVAIGIEAILKFYRRG